MSKDTPKELKPFQCHGAHLRFQDGLENWVGDCPFCGKEEHFFADPKKGMWDCKSCGERGNPITFLTKIAAHRHAETSRSRWRKLSADRGIPASVLKAAGLGWDAENRCWLIPCFSAKGTVRDIKRWSPKYRKSMVTAGCKSQLWGARELAKAKAGWVVWLCEGEWDAIALRWLFRETDLKKNVAVAVPGASVLKKDWIPLFADMDVVSAYDADDAGDRGHEMATRKLGNVSRSIKYVCWPDGTRDSYDIRDLVVQLMAEFEEDPDRDLVEDLAKLLADKPRRVQADATTRDEDEEDLEPIEIPELMKIFGEHLEMRSDLEDALRVMLAVALSNDVEGDPLWVYIVGPPGCGKTVLLCSLKTSGRCLFRSTVTPHGLISGWKGEGSSDPSLIPKLKGLTFVLKDFTEVLTMPIVAQDEIFSCLRGAYDGAAHKSFGNGVNRQYDDCYFSMLAGVTHAIHGHRKASLGERFLKFEIKMPPSKEAETVALAALDSIGHEREREEALALAVRRYLARQVDVTELPTFSPRMRDRLSALVRLIAFMRAEVDRDWRTNEISYRPAVEAGTRLIKQLGKFGMLLGHINGDGDKISDETYARVERVAMDTAHGFHLDVLEAMMSLGGLATKKEIGEEANLPSSTLARRIDDLTMLGAVVREGKQRTHDGRPSVLFKVANEIAELWYKSKGGKPWKIAISTGKGRSQRSGRGSARRKRNRSGSS